MNSAVKRKLRNGRVSHPRPPPAPRPCSTATPASAQQNPYARFGRKPDTSEERGNSRNDSRPLCAQL